MNWVTYDVLGFLLVMARIIGVFISAPIFNSASIPRIAKINLVFIFAVLIFPSIPVINIQDLGQGYNFLIYAMNEIIIGISIGLFVTIFLTFINVAGAVIDRNIGFSMVSVISSMDNTQIPVTANLLYVVAMLVYLAMNFHHLLFKAIVASFDKVPIGYFFYNEIMVEKIVNIFIHSFTTGVIISAPFIVVILIANLILGLLSKAMPGMNVFVIGMPFKIFFGLMLMIILMPYLVDKIGILLVEMFDMLMDFLISV